MKGRKIILTVTNDLTHDRRMQRICTALAAADYDVLLVGRRLNNSAKFNTDRYKATRLHCWFNTGLLFYKEYNIRLFFFLMTHRFEMACACDLDTALPVRLTAWLRGKKAVYDAHEYFTEVPELLDRPLVKSIWEIIARWTIPGFHVRYTVGEELANLMSKKYGVPFHVVRNIEPGHSFRGAASVSRARILFYQGALNVGRGLEVCIRSMVHLPGWELWLAGEGDISDHLKDLVRQHGVGEQVKFLGWVKSDALPGLLQTVWLNINLREAGSLNDYYSLPNKFFDAIQAGLPSLNMNYPEYARICTAYPCAILLDEVSEEKFTEAILYLDRHPEKWYSMEAACHEAAKMYTWEKESEKLIQIYSSLQ